MRDLLPQYPNAKLFKHGIDYQRRLMSTVYQFMKKLHWITELVIVRVDNKSTGIGLLVGYVSSEHVRQ